MTKDKQHINVPHLRFPEFTGEWKEHSLSEYLEFKNGLNPDAKRIGKGIPFLSVMDILADGVINYDNIRGKVEATEKEIESFGVNSGDLLFQRSSETLEDVGRANVYMDNRTAVYGGFVIRGRKIGSYDPFFVKYLLATPLARKRTCRMGAGAQHFNIGQESLAKISLYFPSMEEQQKIAEFLSLLDERIATQNKIIKKLETLIKALSHKLTTQKKPNTLLKNCLVCHSSTLLESHVKGKGQYPVFGATGICGYTDKSDISGDSILIIKDGAGVGTTTYATGKYSVIGTLNYLQSTQEHYSLLYIYYSLKTFDFRPYITGMAIPHIYFRDYGKAKIWCPDIVEQKRIATVLRTMDAKLKINHSILRNLTLQKQYLLSNLFI